MRTTLALLSIALALGLAACSSALARKSAQHTILAAGSHGAETSWTPAEEQITNLEQKLGHMFYSVDARISGLPDGVPPYPLSEYNIRYTGTGPAESRYILGEAMHKSLPEAEKLLSTDRIAMPERGGPRYFTVMYDMKNARVTAVRFNSP